jgi:DNA helicase-2/ATP-dependent DNA helicase PcrA
VVDGYVVAGNEPSLGAFLRFAALATSLDEELAARDRVTLMTIHSAKGREWPLVFLIGVEDGSIPVWWAKSPEQIEEERRVLYVGMTRARRQLCLMWANETGGRERPLSDFLCSLPPETMTHVGRKAPDRAPLEGRSAS